jgi:hypothetical protein
MSYSIVERQDRLGLQDGDKIARNYMIMERQDRQKLQHSKETG